MQERRIVSLIASATEIVCALGLERSLVGRSHECDFPSSVKSLPVCTRPKFEPDGRSYEIDQKVKALVQEALSVYLVDAPLLDSLSPTHIITQTQCEVCAVSLRDVEEAVCAFARSTPRVVALQPDSLAGVWRDISLVGDALGARGEADALVEKLKARMGAVAEKARGAARETKPAAAAIEWIAPLMAGGNWMPELIEMAGGVNLFGEAGKHSPWMSWEDLVRKDPDVILILPCGFDIPRTLAEMDLLDAKPEWKNLKAVESGKVFVLDGNQYFNRPGPRLAESLEILAEIFHPDTFHFGHEGAGWINYRPRPPLPSC